MCIFSALQQRNMWCSRQGRAGGGKEWHLPGQGAAQEVQQHVAERLDVVPPALLDAEVGVNAGVARSACEVFVLAVGDVDVGLRVPVLLGQAKIDDVDLVGPLAQAHEEVVGLDVAVDEALGVHVLDARDLGQCWRSVGSQPGMRLAGHV